MNHPDPRDSGENLFDEADEDEVRRESKKPEKHQPARQVRYSKAEEEEMKEELGKKSEKRRWAIFLRKRKN
jgi:hypothetical protein